ncbi:histidinol-phosphatase HisJ family protein [Oceanobacillus halotolerans]|uniref:histidinol-phosphatase HisJ family protein n=1 Tax=Oceanobacillus halotolerans TaxID=2663380 RepID=UPI0013D8EF93|nr:histidinol-phosphatase HisJ family protein [Oceanobacillus halotolerans]
MFDYHIHSDFSADCNTPMEETVKSAVEKGVTEICFTEHIDYDYPDSSIVFEFNLEDYDQKLNEIKQNYQHQITLKKGIEIGVQPHLLKRYNDLLQNESFDFIICSMHTTDRKDLHSGSFFNNKTVDEAFLMYYEELLSCIKQFKNYNVLGHVDLVKRYATEKPSNDFHDVLTQIFKQVIADGKGIELNTSGFRYGLENGMPSVDILKLYKECGGEILTLGSDSHVSSTVAYQFNESIELLESIGFKYITTFEQQKPQFHPIDKVRKQNVK